MQQDGRQQRAVVQPDVAAARRQRRHLGDDRRGDAQHLGVGRQRPGGRRDDVERARVQGAGVGGGAVRRVAPVHPPDAVALHVRDAAARHVAGEVDL